MHVCVCMCVCMWVCMGGRGEGETGVVRVWCMCVYLHVWCMGKGLSSWLSVPMQSISTLIYTLSLTSAINFSLSLICL